MSSVAWPARTRLPVGAAVLSAALVSCAGACKSDPVKPPVAAPAPPPAPLSFDRKMTWLLRLEQQRVVRDAVSAEETTPAAPDIGPIEPARSADLVALIRDTDGNIRRRAALAIGRLGRPEGVQPLTAALT